MAEQSGLRIRRSSATAVAGLVLCLVAACGGGGGDAADSEDELPLVPGGASPFAGGGGTATDQQVCAAVQEELEGVSVQERELRGELSEAVAAGDDERARQVREEYLALATSTAEALRRVGATAEDPAMGLLVKGFADTFAAVGNERFGTEPEAGTVHFEQVLGAGLVFCDSAGE